MKNNFSSSLPDAVQILERKRETSREIDKNLADVRTHWKAMQSIPEIAEKAKDIDVACEYDILMSDIDKKISEVQAMPLPITDKNEVICEWKEIKRQVQLHGEKLLDAVDYFPSGYLIIEDSNPSSVDISPKDRRELEEKGATVAVPQKAKDLYQAFLRVVQAAKEFEQYQFNNNLNVRDFISCITHIRNAEDFAKNWINGTWERY